MTLEEQAANIKLLREIELIAAADARSALAVYQRLVESSELATRELNAALLDWNKLVLGAEFSGHFLVDRLRWAEWQRPEKAA